MNALPILLLAGAGFFLMSKKSKPTTSTGIQKDLPKGFEVSEDCKKFIVTDLDVAKKWAFNEGKKIKIKSKNKEEAKAEANIIIDQFQSDMMGKCKPESFQETKENNLFIYDIMINYFDGLLSIRPEMIYFMYGVIGMLKLAVFTSLEKLKTPVNWSDLSGPMDLLMLKKLTTPLKGYEIKNCILTISSESKMMSFVRNLAKNNVVKSENLNQGVSILEAIIYDFCTETKEDIEIPEKIVYLVAYNILKGFVEAQPSMKEDANKMLASFNDEFGKTIKEFNLPTEV